MIACSELIEDWNRTRSKTMAPGVDTMTLVREPRGVITLETALPEARILFE